MRRSARCGKGEVNIRRSFTNCPGWTLLGIALAAAAVCVAAAALIARASQKRLGKKTAC